MDMDLTQYVPDLSNPAVQAFISGFPVTLAHAGVTVLMLFVGATVYVLLSPYKEIALIREGNAAAAVALGGVLIGLAAPLAATMSVSTSILEICVWGVATLLLQLLVFRLIDMLLTGLPQRIQEGEVSAAVLLVSAKLAAALILAAAVSS
jgi:putative membrane protein